MKVSIIIPVYKVEAYLDECVASVVGQSYKNLEIILVDDGSPDRCPAMCDSWAEKDSRINVIHKSNGGLSDARNVGLDVCTGSYVLFLDSDDYLTTTAVEELVETATSNNADIVVYNFFRDSIQENAGSETISKIDKETAFINMAIYPNYIMAQLKLYRKEIFNVLCFEKGRLHEDEFICHKVFNAATNIFVYDKSLYYYRQTPNSIVTSRPKLKNLTDSFAALEERLKFLQTNNYAKAYLANERRLYTVFFAFYPEIRAKDIDEKQAKNAIRHRIKTILPVLKRNPFITERGYKLSLLGMSVSVELTMMLLKFKRRLFNR